MDSPAQPHGQPRGQPGTEPVDSYAQPCRYKLTPMAPKVQKRTPGAASCLVSWVRSPGEALLDTEEEERVFVRTEPLWEVLKAVWGSVPNASFHRRIRQGPMKLQAPGAFYPNPGNMACIHLHIHPDRPISISLGRINVALLLYLGNTFPCRARFANFKGCMPGANAKDYGRLQKTRSASALLWEDFRNLMWVAPRK